MQQSVYFTNSFCLLPCKLQGCKYRILFLWPLFESYAQVLIIMCQWASGSMVDCFSNSLLDLECNGATFGSAFFCIGQNSAEEMLQLVEHYYDYFRMALPIPTYMNFISSYGNNIFSQEQLRKQKTTCVTSRSYQFSQVSFLPFALILILAST